MSAPVRVTVDGEPVTREVTLDQVREYMCSKGWEKRSETDRDDFGKPLGATVEIWGKGIDPKDEILLWTGGVAGAHIERRTANAIGEVARSEQRHPAAVLREIANVGADAMAVDARYAREHEIAEAWKALLFAERCHRLARSRTDEEHEEARRVKHQAEAKLRALGIDPD